MIHYSLPDAGHIRYAEGFSAREIALPATAANVAEVHLTEDYPEIGYACNMLSDMIVHILEGEVTVEFDGNTVTLPSGSTAFVPKKQRYCWVTDSVRMLVFSTPPWTPEQHQHIPE